MECCHGPFAARALYKEEVQFVRVKVSVRMKAIAVTNVSLGTRAGAFVASYRMGRVWVESPACPPGPHAKAKVIWISQANPPPW